MHSIREVVSRVGGPKVAASTLSTHVDAPRPVNEATVRMWMSREAVPAAWRTILASVACSAGMAVRASDLPLRNAPSATEAA